MRRALTLTTLGVLLALSVPAVRGEPPVERTLVTAVADGDQDRILVRWRTLEGMPRYRFFDVLRRDANGTAFTRLNGDPVGPLTDAAAIQAVFTAPGRADALAWIRETFGEDYATALLRLQGPGAPSEAKAQLTFLPDQNYGAALALGLGWLDEPVVHGATYVYEVWGVNELGAAVERLGRASAVAGSPGALSAPVLDCVEPGDQRADGAAFLRWTDVPDENRYIAGYEVYRRPCDPEAHCPADMSPGHPESVKANRYPVLAASAGRVKEGKALFGDHCASCHAREQMKGKTLEGFRARQHGDVGAPPGFFVHDTTDLNALSSDSLAAIFDYIHEFRFRDDGDDTPAGAVAPGCYCYQAVPRDLLGELGTPSTRKECAVKDLIPPEVPALVRSARVVASGSETCEISWQRNDDAADGTVAYELLRRQGAVPRNEYLRVDGNILKLLATIPQPGSGARVSFTDASIGAAEATGLFFYAVRAKDAWGNLSPISGWVPCVPRDIAAPPPPTPIEVACCAVTPGGGCNDLGADEDWLSAGGDPDFVVADPASCPPRFVYDLPGDAFRVRVSRSFDGVDWYEEKDIVPEPCAQPYAGHYCYTPVFTPVVDQKIWHRLIALDKSGNRSAASSYFYAILKGRHAPPAPTIFQVVAAPLEEPDMPNRLKVRFRSLNPGALLGFALYKRQSVPAQIGQPVWVGKGPFVKVFPGSNFANQTPDPNDPEQWIVRAGAKTLKQLSEDPGLPPVGPEYLHYNSIDDTYEIAVDAGDPENIVLSLAAIGWTGLEGKWGSETWDGWVPNDDKLDWPRFRARVPIVLSNPPDTSIAIEKLHDWSMRLSWSADPAGCRVDADSSQPFVVFRRREDAPNWQQISPLFGCRYDQGTDPLTFRDRDVEDGTWYRYAVVQLDQRGEFTYLRTSDPVCYDIYESCEGPAPE